MSDSTGQNPNLVPKIIWGALTFSQAIHLGLALFAANPSAEQIESMANSPMPMVFFGMGLMLIGMGTFFITKIVKPSENPTNPAELLTPRIIQWAMIEAGMVMGLVTALQGGPSAIPIGLFVVALLAMLKTFPKDLTRETEAE